MNTSAARDGLQHDDLVAARALRGDSQSRPPQQRTARAAPARASIMTKSFRADNLLKSDVPQLHVRAVLCPLGETDDFYIDGT